MPNAASNRHDTMNNWVTTSNNSADISNQTLTMNTTLHNVTNPNNTDYSFQVMESLEQGLSSRSMTSIGRSFFRRESAAIRLFPFPSTHLTRLNASRHPQFRIKLVYAIECLYCSTFFCHRGMKAILLGDRNIELYSTDISPNGIQPVFNDYSAKLCLYILYIFNEFSI